MKTITKSEDCLKCKECCKFEKDDLYFSPIFTSKEVEEVRKRFGDVECFVEYKGSKNVFQIRMLKSEKGGYVCPLLDEDTHLCKIYDIRPFDCKLWPFMLARVKGKKGIYVVCFDKCLCMGLENISPEEFETYKGYITNLLKSKEYKKLIKDYPQLVWDYYPDIFEVAEIKL